MKFTVLIVELDDVLSAGLRVIFENNDKVERVAVFSSLGELQKCLCEHQKNLIIVNQSLITNVSMLPSEDFVIVTSKLDVDFFLQAYHHGARGYLLNNASTTLWHSLINSDEASFLLDPVLAFEVMPYLLSDSRFIVKDALLTPREREIVYLLREGMSRPLIAEKLCISEATLKTHIKNIFKKKREDYANALHHP